VAQHVTLQKQTPLLTHCTNPLPLNFIVLDNRNSGVNLGIYNEAGKAQAEIAGMSCYTNLHQICTSPPIGPI
jgi:hypothetical protein